MSSNALALQQTMPVARTVIEAACTVAGRVFNPRNPKAGAEMAANLLRRDPEGRLIVKKIVWRAVEPRDQKIPDLFLEANVKLPGNERPTIVLPLISVNVPYVHEDETGIVQGNDMVCIFFDLPKKEGKGRARLRAFPLGLVPSNLLIKWNMVADQLGTLPHIRPIEGHPLSTGDPQHMEWTPHMWDPEKTGRLLGSFYGKNVLLSGKSQEVPADEPDDGRPSGFYTSWTFSIIERPTVIVAHLVTAKQVDTSSRGAETGSMEDFTEPFVALGTTLKHFSPRDAKRFVAQCAGKKPLDDRNSLLTALEKRGFPNLRNDPSQARQVLRHVGGEVIDVAKGLVKEAFSHDLAEVTKQTRGASRLKIADLLRGSTLKAALKQRVPEDDPAGAHIKGVLGEFDPERPYDKRMRRELIKWVAKKDGYEDPSEDLSEEKTPSSDVSQATPDDSEKPKDGSAVPPSPEGNFSSEKDASSKPAKKSAASKPKKAPAKPKAKRSKNGTAKKAPKSSKPKPDPAPSGKESKGSDASPSTSAS